MSTALGGNQALGQQPSQENTWQGQGSQLLSTVREAALNFTQREKKDEDIAYNPYSGLSKSDVLLECRMFNDPQFVPEKCKRLLTKILYLLGQGEKMTRNEATEVFFGVTKLFHSKDAQLRRMIYLTMKELKPSAEEVIIVTATLTKDMNSKMDLYRANAIRVLCNIISATDPSMLVMIERHLKQAVVDRNPFVASSALVSGIHLLKVNPEVVKRWVNEVQTAVQSDSNTVQYHALALLHSIKRQDRLAVSKVVASLARSPMKSPHAHCLLIRFAKKVMEEDDSGNRDRTLFDFLEGSLRHRSDMVIYEAASAICSLPNVTQTELSPAITVLQLFLSSPQPCNRFAALRTLNRVAMAHPLAVTPCNMDMEGLINDENRSIATLAITTLLKTGSESGVERLMKQITSFMSEIADEFKIVVVDAIRAMCLKYPQKHHLLMSFLSNVLREEGGFSYKKAIVDTILTLISKIPEAKEAGLAHLCEFIEDCEFTMLSTQILHLLAVEGPSTNDPAKYIRFIYNRVVLENATVRASAVSALAKFGVQLERLRPSILVLLQRCLHDNDDEVRDRATFFVSVLKNMDDPVLADSLGADPRKLIMEPMPPVPLNALEASLKEYMANPSTTPFSIHEVTVSAEMLAAERKSVAAAAAGASDDSEPAAKTSGRAAAAAEESEYDLLNKMPQFVHLGARFCSSKKVALTESETEYSVSVVKHMFQQHILLHFHLNNTLEDQLLENVSVKLDLGAAPGFELDSELPCAKLPHETPETAFVCLRRTEVAPTGTMPCTLKFMVKDVDPANGEPDPDDVGYDDEYQVEDLEISAADYMRKQPVADFRGAWESMGNTAEVVETFSLTYNSILEAMNAVISFLGMEVCENTGQPKEGSRTHTVLLAGIFLGGSQVFSIVNLRSDAGGAVGMRLTVRSPHEQISQFVASSVA